MANAGVSGWNYPAIDHEKHCWIGCDRLTDPKRVASRYLATSRSATVPRDTRSHREVNQYSSQWGVPNTPVK
ncbi:hypothetical protein JCM18750_34990 [Halostagnicola bangensis]